MKYRPLCTSYLTDAKSRLEEATDQKERPLLFIEQVIGSAAEEESSSSGESEYEQQQQAPAPRPRVRKRARFSLDDDASFEFIKQQDPVKENENSSSDAEESSQEEQKEAHEALLNDDDDASFLESSSQKAIAQQVMEDDIFSMDSSSDGEAPSNVKPFQLETLVTTRKRASIPVPTHIKHPLVDTDDDESSDIDMFGRTGRLTKKEHPPRVVDVSIQHSPVEDLLLLDSQSQDMEMVDNEADTDKGNVNAPAISDTAAVLSSPTSKDASECKAQEMDKAVEIVEESHDSYLLEEASDVIMEEDNQQAPVADDATKPQKQVVTEYQPIDATVIERIMQTLRDCQSRKLITADPRTTATFQRGSMSSARAGFWASDPNHGSMTTSPASFFDIVYGNEGMQHLRQLTSLRDTGHSVLRADTESPIELQKTNDREDTTRTEVDTETCSALEQPVMDGQQDSNQETDEEIRKENATAFVSSPNPSDHVSKASVMNDTETTRRVDECLVANIQSTKLEALQDHCNVAEIHESDVTALSECRALVPLRNSTAAVPPIWLAVCQAIMNLQKENPEALRMLASSTNNRKEAIHAPSVADTMVQESIGGKDSTGVHSASAEDQTPIVNHRSTVASLEAPVVSDEKPKKTAIVQEQNPRSDEEKPRRRHRTEQEKLDRRERKRLKKEKRERKKQKKAERNERKRKARDQNHPPNDDKTLDSPLQNIVQQQPPVDRSFEKEGVGFAKDIADTQRDEKRQKVERIQDSIGATGETLLVREQFDRVPPRKESGVRQEIEPTLRSEKPPLKPNAMQPKQVDKCTRNRQERKGTHQKPVGAIRPPTGGTRMNEQEEAEAANKVVDNASLQEKENTTPSLRALCSEAFFEEWSEATALLASGQWLTILAPPRHPDDDSPPPLGPSIQLFDTPLLEERGIDIELPGHAIIIFQLSSWGTTKTARNDCARHLIKTTALKIYKEVDVIIVADVAITAAISIDIAFVQNAVIAQAGLNYSCSPSFQVIAPRLLAPVVASRVMSTPSQGVPMDSFINASISDIRLQERVRFMQSLAPSLSVIGAIQCLVRLSTSSVDGEQNVDDFTSQGFQRLIRGCTTIDRNDPALRQLSLAINISLSYERRYS